ncbi:MAG: DUF202 domain-containing protein [Gemmatimonas sp.]|nr:DUF202 domain-containing protein [Gemmatimonas sp.]
MSVIAAKAELPDNLAVDRTHLANERTLLAYFRTVLGAEVAGVAFLAYADFPGANQIGWFLIAFGAAILPFGLWRFATVRGHVHRAGLASER